MGPSLLETLQPAHWPTLVLVATRLTGLFLIAPLWSLQAMPKSVRGALIVVLAAGLAPTIPPVALPDAWQSLPLPLAAELLVGLAIGMTGAVFMWGMALAGEVISLQMGLNIGQAIGLAESGAPSGVGELKSMLVLLLYITLDGHLILLQGVAESFRVLTPGSALDLARGGEYLVTLGGTVFETGLRAAMPVSAALLLVNFGFAILSKAVPQLNAMTTAFPVTLGVGLVVFGLSLPYLGRFVAGWTGGLAPQAAAAVRAFAGGAP